MYRQNEALASFLPRWQLELLGGRRSLPESPAASAASGAILFVDVSGFTKLTRSFATEGKRGAEKLSTVIDSIFGPVTRIVASHGGDILVFAGDSAIALWRVTENDTLEQATIRAISAARVIQSRNFDASESGNEAILLRSSVGAGDIRSLELGGVDNNWLFMVDGGALEQVVECDSVAEPGTVTLSSAVLTLTGDRVVASPIGHNAARLERLHGEPAHLGEFRSLPVPSQEVWPHLVPRVVLQRVSEGFADWLAEFRTASVAVMSLDHGDGDVATLDKLVRLMQESILRLEGQVYQCLVDDKGANLLAMFGMPPFAHEDDAQRCLLAAIDIRDRLAEIGVASSIGIATGTIWSGLYGSRERRQYSIVGPAINLASRLMRLAKGRVVCDATTARPAGTIVLSDAGLVDVKGYDEPVQAFEAADVCREPAAAGSRERFVGREEERRRIAAMIGKLEAEAKGGVVLIEAQTGFGKSTLVSRVMSDIPEPFSILFGAAEAIDAARPYAVWKRIFQELLGIPGAATPGEPEHAQLLDSLGDRADHAPLLNVAIGSVFPDNDVTLGLTSELRAARTRALLSELVIGRARRQPLLIVLEGGHWFDSHSWSLARTIADANAPVLLLITTRPQESLPTEIRALVSDPDNQRLELEALSREETLALVKARLGVSDLPRELGELVVDRAAGHPLFVEQLLLALGEAGVYEIDDDLCILKGSAAEREKVATDVALSLGGIVLGRTDRLSPSQQLAIKTASVIGMQFASSMLAAVHPGDRRETLLADLDALVERRFLRRSEQQSGSYAFDNALIRDVIYESLPFQQRRTAHHAIAEWHRDAGLADSPAFWPVLAHHFRYAETYSEATAYFEKAGSHALGEHANAEAVRYLDEALELCNGTSSGSHGELLVKHGLANVNWSRHETGRSSLESGLALLDRELPASAGSAAIKSLGQLAVQFLRRLRSAEPPDRQGVERELNLQLSRGYEGLVEAYFIAGEQMGCLYCALRALNVAETAGASAELARGYASISALFGMMRLEKIARTYKDRALDTAAKVGDPEAHAWAMLSVGIYKLGNADWPVAKEHLREAAESYRKLQHPRREHDCRISLSNLHLVRGDVDSAAQEIDRCEHLARVTRDLRAEGAILRNRIACHAFRHDYDALADDARKMKQFLSPDVAVASAELEMLFALRAWVASRLGQQAEAEEYAAIALAAITRHGTAAYPLVTEFFGLAQVWLRSDGSRKRELESLAQLVRAHARAFPIGQPGHLWLSGRLALDRGSSARARRLFTKSALRSEQLAMPFNAVLAHVELADTATGDQERRTHLETARRLAEPIGLEPDHVRT